MMQQRNKRINTMIEKTCYKYRNEMIVELNLLYKKPTLNHSTSKINK